MSFLRWFKSTWILECFRIEHQSNSRTSITWLIELPDPARLRIAVFMFCIRPIPSNEPKNDSRRNGSVQTFSEFAIISQICQSRRLYKVARPLIGYYILSVTLIGWETLPIYVCFDSLTIFNKLWGWYFSQLVSLLRIVAFKTLFSMMFDYLTGEPSIFFIFIWIHEVR